MSLLVTRITHTMGGPIFLSVDTQAGASMNKKRAKKVHAMVHVGANFTEHEHPLWLCFSNSATGSDTTICSNLVVSQEKLPKILEDDMATLHIDVTNENITKNLIIDIHHDGVPDPNADVIVHVNNKSQSDSLFKLNLALHGSVKNNVTLETGSTGSSQISSNVNHFGPVNFGSGIQINHMHATCINIFSAQPGSNMPVKTQTTNRVFCELDIRGSVGGHVRIPSGYLRCLSKIEGDVEMVNGTIECSDIDSLSVVNGDVVVKNLKGPLSIVNGSVYHGYDSDNFEPAKCTIMHSIEGVIGGDVSLNRGHVSVPVIGGKAKITNGSVKCNTVHTKAKIINGSVYHC